MFQIANTNVLVPTDYSERAGMAIDTGLELAGEGTKLTVLHVAPPLGTFAAGDPAVVWNTVSDDSRQEYLEKAFRNQFADPKYEDIRFEVIFGSPADGIAQFAQEHHIGMIVLPSHGRTGFARLMIGSVAERVVRLAHCPVLVLRE